MKSNGLEELDKLKYIEIDNESDGESIYLNERYYDEFKTIENELRAFKLVNEHQVFVAFLMASKDVDDYNKRSQWFDSALTQEEYDFLRKMFKDGFMKVLEQHKAEMKEVDGSNE